MQSTYFCQISKVFLLECVIVFVDAEKLLIASITFLASTFGKEVRLADFTIEFFIKLAKEKKGINFKTPLVA